MDKLITSSNGGFPYKLDDLRFEQEALRNAFLGFITGFSITAAESFIIRGCEVTGDDIAEGYIFLEGEICKVDAHTMPTPGGGEVRYFELAISYDSVGFKQFENSTTAETYQVRKASVLAGVGTGKFLLTGAKTLYSLINENVGNPLGVFPTFTYDYVTITGIFDMVAPIFITNGWPGIISDFRKEVGDSFSTWLQAKKRATNLVQLSGTFDKKSIEDATYGYADSAWFLIGTLPVGYRPSQTILHLIQPNVWVKISNSGTIKFYTIGVTDFGVYFNSLPPFYAV